MRIGVLGLGAVGARAARQVASSPAVSEVVVADVDGARADRVARAMGVDVVASTPEAMSGVDTVILATPAPHAGVAAGLLERGVDVVSVSDDLADVRALIALDHLARRAERTVIAGAGFSPGLVDLLARKLARRLDTVDEIHVAKHGTGGPACARQHHLSLAGWALQWYDGEWVERPAGSGRELCWFPDPLGAWDCYVAELAEPLLLVPSFPGVERVTARMSATRRDRITARFPMLRPPHAEGGLSGVRIDVRGTRDGERRDEIAGSVDRAGIAAGAVAAVVALRLSGPRRRRPGHVRLADDHAVVDDLLAELARRGIRGAEFVGRDPSSAATM
jgi:saccharopine dehydrogenase-like NADP-dependent oxidoreductase